MSLPINMYQSIMASSFAARGVEKPVGVAAAAPTFTQQMTAQFMAPAKKEFSAGVHHGPRHRACPGAKNIPDRDRIDSSCDARR